MAKGNLRSFRLSDECISIIEAAPGISMTRKFENLVFECYQVLPQKQAEMKALQRDIEREQKYLSELRSAAEKLSANIRTLNWSLETVQGQVNRVSAALSDMKGGDISDE